MLRIRRLFAATAALSMLGLPVAHAWQPTKPIEFVVTSGPGGGTDNFARVVQSIVAKYKLVDQPIGRASCRERV